MALKVESLVGFKITSFRLNLGLNHQGHGYASVE